MIRDIVLIYNPLAGHFLEQCEGSVQEYFEGLLRADSHLKLRLEPFDGGQLAQLSRLLQHDKPDAVWVAGGDGTVLSVAEITSGLGIPLGVLPGGTMNLLARDIGMSLDMVTAIGQLADAQPEKIDMAELNGKPFLCISNIGMSTRLTERRERLRQHAGWVRWPLMGWYMLRFMFAYRSMVIHLKIGGQVHSLHTRSVTISNNPLAAESSLIPVRKSLNCGLLGIYIARDRSLWSLPRLIFRLLTRDWQNDPDMLSFRAESARIQFLHRKRVLHVMSDGELNPQRPPLEYCIHPQALTILKPREAL
ncbi:diacylglycerol/lipid kinase family protein [Marinobacterium jannaschii]|uniref:diacylglycerol/lipid kinase family protein n=1 Tax=Marinobacterium jannaschii TaxID=64970 RepID=UPI000488F83D|nr:diacylglycerol kinase family protein [Marinobacterium jannaschii]